jgi:hypothetical protein
VKVGKDDCRLEEVHRVKVNVWKEELSGKTEKEYLEGFSSA